MVTVSPVVTVPAPKDNARPFQTVFAPTVIALALSMIVPENCVFAPRVVAAEGVQKMSQTFAPVKVTTEPFVEVRAPTDRNKYVPFPVRLIPPMPMFMAPTLQ